LIGAGAINLTMSGKPVFFSSKLSTKIFYLNLLNDLKPGRNNHSLSFIISKIWPAAFAD
jgi:hypothetical protein